MLMTYYGSFMIDLIERDQIFKYASHHDVCKNLPDKHRFKTTLGQGLSPSASIGAWKGIAYILNNNNISSLLPHDAI